MKKEEVKKESFGFSKDFLDTLHQTVKIEEIIGEHVALKRAGQNLVGCCPFHSEKTPSFNVIPTRQFYHCFGCSVGGDCIKFVMQREGLSFVETVKYLAERYNIPLPAFTTSAKYVKEVNTQEKIGKLNELALEHWKSQLEISDPIKDYLKERGLTEETTQLFQFGYAQDHWDTLKTELCKGDTTDLDLFDAGLLAEKDGKYYDKFRNRIIIPVFNARGKVVAFTGRIFGKGEPKYLNSPETAVYTKGDNLFGFYQTKSAIRDKQFALLAEGALDAIFLYQAGVHNVVASLGTALTTNQAKLLRRIVDKVVICYDGDKAGQKATERAIGILLTEGFTIKVVILPDNKDPEEYIKEFGVDTFNKRRGMAVTWFKFITDRIQERFNCTNPTEKAKAIEEALTFVVKAQTDIEKQEYFDAMMRTFKVEAKLAKKLWSTLGLQQTIKPSEVKITLSIAESKLLEGMLTNNEYRAKTDIGEVLKESDSAIYPILVAINGEESIDYNSLEESLSDDLYKAWIREVLAKSEDVLDAEEIDECMKAIQRNSVEIQLEEIGKSISAESSEEEIFKLVEQQFELLEALDYLA